MYVFSNLAVSIDGKIATTERSPFIIGSKKDWKLLVDLRGRADVTMIGAETIRSHKGKKLLSETKRKGAVFATISRKLDGISAQWPFFTDPDIRRLLFVTEKLKPKVAAAFSKRSEIIQLKSNRSTATQIIRELKNRGVKKLLVEGGGNTLWDLVKKNLIDEYNITPRVLGGKDAPTLVDGEGFSPKQSLKVRLHSVKRDGHELFLVYKKTH